jgi:hypothetical protein
VSLAEVIARYTPSPEAYRGRYAGRAPEWLDEVDVRPGPPHLRMGTRALDLDDWFVIDELRDAELALRRRLLAERRDDVFAALPSAGPASEEVHGLVRSWLSERGLLVPHEEAGAVGGPDPHPLAAAGLLVQDDLCLMVRRDGGWHLDGGIVCFPSVWRLADKLGRSAAAVHAPVEHYAEELAARVDRFLDRLDVGKPVWRRNLSVKPTNALFLPVRVPDGGDGPRWLRSERQTLRKLPRTGAILCTIRTQLAPAGRVASGPCESD